MSQRAVSGEAVESRFAVSGNRELAVVMLSRDADDPRPLGQVIANSALAVENTLLRLSDYQPAIKAAGPAGNACWACFARDGARSVSGNDDRTSADGTGVQLLVCPGCVGE